MLKFLYNRDCSLQPETFNSLLELTETKSPFVGLVFDSILIKSKSSIESTSQVPLSDRFSFSF